MLRGSTFFRKKFLPDFLSPLLVRTPRWRMYRLMALTTAALWGGVSQGPEMRADTHTPMAMGALLSPKPSPLHSLPTPAPQPVPGECLRKAESAPEDGAPIPSPPPWGLGD